MSAATPMMYPIMLNLTELTVFVVGTDATAATRVQTLAAHGAGKIVRFIDELPGSADFNAHSPRLIFVSGLGADQRAEIHRLAKNAGALVHTQDVIPLCDFHLPAWLRRGKLLVTVSTDGAVAGLSRLLRDHLAAFVFHEDWAARVEELADARRAWKSRGLNFASLFQAIANHVAARGWLPGRAETSSPGSRP
jgi:precorrin-2 dehydrogenase/sirohydrochlorin ferrochelatase